MQPMGQSSRLLLFLVFSTLLNVHFTASKIIDMSHKLKNTTFYFKAYPRFNRVKEAEGELVPGVYFTAGYYTTSEHTGTHMDAPVHFSKGSVAIDDIPIEWTVADGVKIDCTMEVEQNREYQVTVEKLEKWEKENGRIPDGAAVIFEYGLSKYYGVDMVKYLGSEKLDDVWSFRIPYISAKAGRWLHEKRNVKIIATDTLSPDPYQVKGVKVKDMPLHVLYLGTDRLILENVKIPATLPARGFRFHAPPARIQGASGTPVRAYAVIDDATGNTGSKVKDHAWSRSAVFLLLTMVSIWIFASA